MLKIDAQHGTAKAGNPPQRDDERGNAHFNQPFQIIVVRVIGVLILPKFRRAMRGEDEFERSQPTPEERRFFDERQRAAPKRKPDFTRNGFFIRQKGFEQRPVRYRRKADDADSRENQCGRDDDEQQDFPSVQGVARMFDDGENQKASRRKAEAQKSAARERQRQRRSHQTNQNQQKEFFFEIRRADKEAERDGQNQNQKSGKMVMAEIRGVHSADVRRGVS